MTEELKNDYGGSPLRRPVTPEQIEEREKMAKEIDEATVLSNADVTKKFADALSSSDNPELRAWAKKAKSQ